MIEISVIVPVHNNKKFLPGLLNTLQKQDYNGAYEIIIVDDGSTDGTEEIFKKSRKNLVYIKQENKGPASARNTGLSRARGRIVAFTDGDCLPGGKWLSELRKAFSKGVSGVEGRTIAEGSIFPDSHFIKNSSGGMYVTSNIAFLRSTIKGGFDARYRYPNREDSDVAFRLLRQGKKIAFGEKCVVRHRLLRSSLKSMLKRKIYFESDMLLFKKYPDLYRKNIRFPFDRFAPLYFLIALAGFVSPLMWLGLPVLTLVEIACRKYTFSVASFLKFLVSQTVGSFLNVFAILKGCVRYKVNPLRLLL